jgi:hypothetical protein
MIPWVYIAVLATIALAGIGFPDRAAAQKLVNSYPAEKFAVAPGGVDLRTGRYVYSETDLSIGPKDGGLTFTRTMSDYSGNRANPFGNFSHNWDIFLLERGLFSGESSGADVYQTTVNYGGRALTFRGPAAGPGFSFLSDTGRAILTLTSGGTKNSPSAVFTAQLPDGSTAVFRPMGGLDCANATQFGLTYRCAYISQLTQADGTQYSFTYAYNSGLPNNRARLTKVVSNRGYALLLEGSGSIVTKSCVIDLSVTADPAGGLCPAGVPSTSYTYTSSNTKLASVTDAAGGVYQFTYTPAGGLTDMGFIKPGQTTPWLTNRIQMIQDESWTPQEVVKNQTFANGQTYSYAYYETPATQNKPATTIIGGTYTNAAGKTVSYSYGFPIDPGSLWNCVGPGCGEEPPDYFQNWVYQTTPGPVNIVDELGRTSTADYCDYTAPTAANACSVIKNFTATDPESAQSRVIQDSYGNIIKVTQNPKPGSGLAPIVTEASFAVTNIRTQNKPLWMKDGKGGQTDFTYDATHGGLLTAMKPAPVAGGARPLTVRTYAQKYAYILSGGSLVAAATPVWMPANETECQTAAGSSTPVCDGSAPQKVMTYEYGANGTADNLLIRGVAVSADGQTLRTCYSYDTRGRKISETKPQANLSVCP